MNSLLYGGVEAGGTKCICGVVSADGQVMARAEIPTTTFAETIEAIGAFFEGQPEITALGIASFGPIELKPESPNYGHILVTPKPGWAGVDIKGALEKRLGVPAVIDTDVSGAALGELHYGAAQGLRNFLYLTVGTGIGGGVVIDGRVYHGALHTELGHMRIPHEALPTDFAGNCPSHGDCLEGLASGSALEVRYGQPPQQLDDVKAWQYEADYLGAALANIILSFSPERIIIGGGVMQRSGLIEAVRVSTAASINNYIELPAPEDYIVASQLPNNGLLGAAILAQGPTRA